MSDERKGVFTPEQEVLLDELVELKGVAEMLDGPAIKLIDNQAIERLKKKLPPEYLPVLYEIIDEVMGAFRKIADAGKP